MLEAFQRSARESAERVAAERRRVIAEREKEIRRAETARTAQEFSSRLSQRAGDSVGSLLAGLRGASAADEVAPQESGAGTSVADAPDIHRVPPVAPLGRGGPALPAFDRAVQEELPEVSSAALGAAPSAAPSGRPAAPAVAERTASDDTEIDPEEDDEPYADASSEEVEEAIAALETEVFELPMSSRAFALLGLAAIVAVFMIGYSVGSRDQVSAGQPNDSSFARAGMSLSSPGGRAADAGALPRNGDSADPSARSGGPGDDYAGGRSASEGDAYAPGPMAQGSAAPLAQDYGPGADSSEAAELAPTAEDLTFRDAEMKFTILAITYSGTEAHARLARETYDELYADGFPVIQPIEKDSRLFLFVGAAKTMGELENLRQELKDLRSGQSRDARPFRSAYLVNIEPYR